MRAGVTPLFPRLPSDQRKPSRVAGFRTARLSSKCFICKLERSLSGVRLKTGVAVLAAREAADLLSDQAGLTAAALRGRFPT